MHLTFVAHLFRLHHSNLLCPYVDDGLACVKNTVHAITTYLKTHMGCHDRRFLYTYIYGV